VRSVRSLLLLIAMAILCPPAKAQTSAFDSDRAIQPVTVLESVPAPAAGRPAGSNYQVGARKIPNFQVVATYQ
jgi:hypothetical protein